MTRNVEEKLWKVERELDETKTSEMGLSEALGKAYGEINEAEMENAELRGIIKRLRQKIEARINELEEIEYKKGIDLAIVRAQITECEIFLSLMDAETAGSVSPKNGRPPSGQLSGWAGGSRQLRGETAGADQPPQKNQKEVD